MQQRVQGKGTKIKQKYKVVVIWSRFNGTLGGRTTASLAGIDMLYLILADYSATGAFR